MTNMFQQLNTPRTESDFRKMQDEMYGKTKEAMNEGELPSFKGLLEVISSEVVIVSAIHKTKSNRGSKTAGTDGVIMEDILKMGYEEVIKLVQDSLKDYKPQPVRRVYIPKAGKKEKRPLGIPAIIDRIVQECIKMTIEPILEAQFFQHSYGFRPMRDTKHALERIVFIQNRIGYNWVVEGDIKGFFDNVNHSILIKQLWHMGIRDRRVLMIIKEMLKAGIMGELERNELGTPQGGIISPLLANVYLHKLDHWITREWEEKEMRTAKNRNNKFASLKRHSTITKPEFYVRYADDWVLFTDSKGNAEKWRYRIKEYLKTNLKLELSDEKTFITNMRKKPIKFVGFQIKTLPMGKKSRYIGYSRPDKDSLNNQVRELRKEIKKLKYSSNKDWLISDIHTLNSKIRGIINYYNCTPAVNLELRKYKETLKYACYKAIKKHGAKWIPANQCYNLRSQYPERSEQVPAVRYQGEWIGIISFSFANWVKKPMKNQLETPYSEEGRSLYFKNSGKRPLLVRVQELTDSDYFLGIMANNQVEPDLYNFEFFMNRAYAFNRDKGKCKVCGDILYRYNLHTHHVDNKLPINEINKVSNLASLCNKCHRLIHLKDVKSEDIIYLTEFQTKKLHKYRGYIHGEKSVS